MHASLIYFRSWLRKSAYILCVFAYFFVCFEIGSRWIWWNGRIDIKVRDDSSWRRRWVLSHSSDAQFQGAKYSFDVYHPSRGWALRNNLSNYRTQGGWVLSSNSRGVRGIKEYPLEKETGIYGIIVARQ